MKLADARWRWYGVRTILTNFLSQYRTSSQLIPPLPFCVHQCTSHIARYQFDFFLPFPLLFSMLHKAIRARNVSIFQWLPIRRSNCRKSEVSNHFSDCTLRVSQKENMRWISVSNNRPEEEPELEFTARECSNRIETTNSSYLQPRIEDMVNSNFYIWLCFKQFIDNLCFHRALHSQPWYQPEHLNNDILTTLCHYITLV